MNKNSKFLEIISKETRNLKGLQGLLEAAVAHLCFG